MQPSQWQGSPLLLFFRWWKTLKWRKHFSVNLTERHPMRAGRVHGRPQPPMLLGAAAAQPLEPHGTDTGLTEATPSSNDEPVLPASLSRSFQLSFPLHLLFINRCLAVLLISATWNNVTFPSTLLFYLLSFPPPAAAFFHHPQPGNQ